MLGVATYSQSCTIFAKDFRSSFDIFSIEMKWVRKIQTSINKNVSQECALMHVANKLARIDRALSAIAHT